MMRTCIATLALLTSACVHRPVFDTYRLAPQDGATVLVPPGVAAATVEQRTWPAGVVAGKGSCAKQAPMLTVRKKRLILTVDAAALAQQKQPGWLSQWTLQAESDGCIGQDEGIRLANRIVQSVPLDSLAAYRLLHPSDVQSGYVELGAENRLEVRSPVMAPSTPPDAETLETVAVSGKGNSLTADIKTTPALVGFEIGWYALRPNTGRPGFHFEALSADRTSHGVVEHLDIPSVNFLQFPPQAAFYRLFYKTDDNGVTAILISGTTRADLDQRTKTNCENAGPMCVALPRRVGVNPFLVVTCNDKDITVGVGGTVFAAIQVAGRKPAEVVGTLRVLRPYQGELRPIEFDRARTEILNVKLGGGERITW